ncbi:hypothetical protein BaRGS_00012181 [Batillaria attramentaria]|uniref:Uncharacterized protein n=1 Tax=Batillaria attramentaria TaxID=370345 RepID=A0ABD0LAQ5_9CAEN
MSIALQLGKGFSVCCVSSGMQPCRFSEVSQELLQEMFPFAFCINKTRHNQTLWRKIRDPSSMIFDLTSNKKDTESNPKEGNPLLMD